MALIYANDQNFNENISKGVVLVDFFADWCGPCKMIAPVLEKIAEEMQDVKIVKVNVDQSQQVSQQFDIMSIPTLILFKDGKVVAKTMGFKPHEMLKAWINQNK